MTSLSDVFPDESAVAEIGTYVPNFDHVMVDIESMSLHKHQALVLSAGLIQFDPRDDETLHIGEKLLLTPNILEQIVLCRRVDVGTQKFWADEIKKDWRSADHWLNPVNVIPVREMITKIGEFCQSVPNVWANGNQFDLANLEQLSEDIGGRTLWHYQAPRDMRTFVKTSKLNAKRNVPPEVRGVPHEPVYDCISQAWRVWSNWDAD